jgi:NAD(P)-dependent dehydrogenase (short-subunit alcohol dehydrogenase family)
MTDAVAFSKNFDLTGKNAVITGGCGVLGHTVCKALAHHGARIAVFDLHRDVAQKTADEIALYPGQTCAYEVNVLNKQMIETACADLKRQWGRIDMLLNFAGGNQKGATVSDDLSFFDLDKEALDRVITLNLQGTILPCQIFGRIMAEQKAGVILNVSSMAAFRPLTRVVGYAAAKAAISNFTQWLAVYMATEHSPAIRVNAIAPGFFCSDQNRALLLDEKTGDLTARGKAIIAHTPMRRFGEPEDLLGTIIWLLSPASAFVTGIVVPVDGGFSAFSGV